MKLLSSLILITISLFVFNPFNSPDSSNPPPPSQANCNSTNTFCQEKAQEYEAQCVQNDQGGPTFYDTCYCKSLRLQRKCLDEAGCASKSIALVLETPGCFQQQ